MIATTFQLSLLLALAAADPVPNENVEEADFNTLPAPLDAIEGNVMDLESDGLFRILDVEYGILEGSGDKGIMWTLAARKNVTYRHALLHFSKYRDVRFYDAKDDLQFEVFSTLLFFPKQFEDRAIQGDVMRRNDVIFIWLYLDKIDVRKIKGQESNKVVFSKTRK